MDVVRQESPKVVFIGLKLAVIRFLPQRTYNKFLNHELKGLSGETLAVHSANFIDCIKFKSSHYHNVSEETNAILNQIPTMRPYKLRVFYTVSAHRKKCGLKN